MCVLPHFSIISQNTNVVIFQPRIYKILKTWKTSSQVILKREVGLLCKIQKNSYPLHNTRPSFYFETHSQPTTMLPVIPYPSHYDTAASRPVRCTLPVCHSHFKILNDKFTSTNGVQLMNRRKPTFVSFFKSAGPVLKWE